MSLNFAKHSKFSYVKFVQSESFIGMSDSQKVGSLNKVFDDAYKTSSACILIDSFVKVSQLQSDRKKIREFSFVGFTDCDQKMPPHKYCKLLIIWDNLMLLWSKLANCSQLIGSTSNFYDYLTFKIQVPHLKENEISYLLQQQFSFNKKFLKKLDELLKGDAINNVLHMSEMVDNKNDINE